MATLKKVTLPVVPIVCFFLCWQMLAYVGFIHTGLFPPPSKIFSNLFSLIWRDIEGQSGLLVHLMVSLKRLLLAVGVGILSGIVVGIFMGLSSMIYRLLHPIISLIMPIPGIAMTPLFIVWMGFGDPTIICIGALTTAFPVAYNTLMGIRSIDHQLVRAAEIMGANWFTVIARVRIPWATVYLFTGIKLGLSRCWRTVIAVELVAATNWGLGYMIWDAAEHLNAITVYGGIILLAVIYAVIEKGLIHLFEKMTIEKWGMIRI